MNYAELATKLGLTKVLEFDGLPKSWQEFYFRMHDTARIYKFTALLKAAEREQGPMLLDGFTSEMQSQAEFLWALLVQACRGRAALLLRLVERGNGFAAWRSLTDEYQPNVPARRTAMLAALLTPTS